MTMTTRWTHAGPAKRTRVLVVDDDPEARGVLRSLLRSRGCDTEEAEDGLQALVRLQHAPFDVVVTDFLMPRLDGLAVVREVNRMPRPIPVLVLTAVLEGSVVSRLRQAGAFRVLRKDGSLTDLAQAVLDASRCRPRRRPAMPDPNPGKQKGGERLAVQL